jgi:hypothetical protein
MSQWRVLPRGSFIANIGAVGPAIVRNPTPAGALEPQPPTEKMMPALLPALLLGSQVLLVADSVPRLDIVHSCRSAGASSVMGAQSGTRNASACEQDENDARGKLQQDWGIYSGDERDRCTRLTTLGGSPSYVELLTCLEMAKAAKQLPAADRMGDESKVGR